MHSVCGVCAQNKAAAAVHNKLLEDSSAYHVFARCLLNSNRNFQRVPFVYTAVFLCCTFISDLLQLRSKRNKIAERKTQRTSTIFHFFFISIFNFSRKKCVLIRNFIIFLLLWPLSLSLSYSWFYSALILVSCDHRVVETTHKKRAAAATERKKQQQLITRKK